MADEQPTNGELGRLIEAMRADMREDMGALHQRLDKAVPLDVYTIEKQAAAEKMAAVNDRVTAVEQQREKDSERVVQTRRWMIGVVITVLIGLLPYLGALVSGAKA